MGILSTVKQGYFLKCRCSIIYFGKPFFRYSILPTFHVLFMACDTIVQDLFFLVASHAPTHRHLHIRFRGRSFSLTHVSVTGLARDLAQNDMTPVGEEDIIRLCVNALPWNLLSFFRKLSNLFFFRTFCHGLFMTLHTDGDVRYSGEHLGLEIAVAGVAFQPLLEMLLVVE